MTDTPAYVSALRTPSESPPSPRSDDMFPLRIVPKEGAINPTEKIPDFD